MLYLVLLAAIAQVGPVAEPGSPAFRVTLKEGERYYTRHDGVRLCLKDAHLIVENGGDPQFTFYVFVPPDFDPESAFKQVALVNNSTISRTSVPVQPRLLKDEVTGAVVIATDLWKLAPTKEKLAEIKGLHERLAALETRFSREIIIKEVAGEPVVEPTKTDFAVGDVVEVRTGGQSGSWTEAKFKSRDGSGSLVEKNGQLLRVQEDAIRRKPQPESDSLSPKPEIAPEKRFTAEAYLNPEGAELFEITNSSVPIIDLEEYVTFGFTTVNGGQYYERLGTLKTLSETVAKFCGFEAGRRTLQATDALRQAEKILSDNPGDKRTLFEVAAEFDIELSKSKAVQNQSLPTGRVRGFLFLSGSNRPPAEGEQRVAATFDTAEGNTAAGGDQRRNLDQYRGYNGGETIFHLPNGFLAYLVTNDKDELIASVPDSVASDYECRKIRSNVATTRVFCGVSCALCHESGEDNMGWQPVRNDVFERLQGLTRILGSAKQGTQRHKNFLEVQRIASAFSADTIALTEMLNRDRLSYKKAVMLGTGAKSSREIALALADSHFGYWYDQKDARHLVLDISGEWMALKEAQAWLIKHLEPNLDGDVLGLIREDLVVDAFKAGESLNPSQLRTVFPNAAERALVSMAANGDEEEEAVPEKGVKED